jgi:hypothetical protein
MAAASPENALKYYIGGLHPWPAHEGGNCDGVLAPQPGADAGRDRIGRGSAFLACGKGGQVPALAHDATI